jgi:hypothetical protein
MDANTNQTAGLPGGAPAARMAPAPSAARGFASHRPDVAAVVKRPRSAAELKQTGRDVAKDLGDGRVNKAKLSGTASCLGAKKQACFEAVTARQYREGKVSVVRGAGPQRGPGGTVFAKRINDGKLIRRADGVAYSGGAEEVGSHADR